MGAIHSKAEAPAFFGVLALLAGTLSLALLGGSSVYTPLATAELLTLAVYQTSALASVQIVTFGIWGVAVGVKLLRGLADSPSGTA